MPRRAEQERDEPSLWSLIDAGARTRPERPALRDARTRHTFRTLHRAVLTGAAALARAGVRPGSTVVLLFENTAESAVAFLAAARLGARLVPAEPDSTPAALADLRRRLGAARENGPHGPVLVGAGSRLAAVTAAGAWPAEATADTAEAPAEADAEALAGPDGEAPAGPDGALSPPAGEDGGLPFLHQYTSGSTGEPKAAVHTQANLVRGARIYADVHGYGEEDRVLLAVPLLHSFGMVSGLVTSLLTGACLTLLGRFSPGALLRELADVRATVLVATPLAYDLLARSAAGSPGSTGTVRLCLSSGAALAEATAERFRTVTGLRIQQVYGSTEAGIIATQLADDPAADRGVGHLVPGVRISLVGEDGEPVAAGEPGALLVRTPAMFAGYHQRPEATEAAFTDGWYATGDVARTDGDGRLHLIGRKDSFINVGGKKVNPAEVEAVVAGHPLVAEAAVWGEELPGGGERVRATVVATGPLAAAELTAYCRERLLPHQVPSGTEFVAALPRTSSGKIRRAALRHPHDHHGTPARGNDR
ncbi:class I adenylate-forming enzyme family protein [Streptomyces sp. NPDC058622]|uniref:class I adenylate-forming enzyme family protein n=1 Tax=Streptomyces sp. NPDC058622 TaxID=3346562 RepID=UPI003668E880